MTVPLLVQIDKLVMLIESPVFTGRSGNSSPTLATHSLSSSPPLAIVGARALSVSLQMPVRAAHAAPAK